MKIFKVINNNIVITLDQNNQEIILMGRGLVFKQRPGNNIDENLIENFFLLVYQIMRNLQSLNYYPIFL
ncbi:CAT RNA binding domain-containing protein [Ligilactobacillus salivarius]|uniref:CAT RNA binding domain-containing protein n=1 Tax=Ligilactobacillus salivarius TaxID=1624 RepID=UPI000C717FC1|nr:CAT RNA binding domain-containing protein [Ligilactobacillus salivarius]RHJ59988.1 RNA-binding protein [Ligilactobacillus salivarius]